MQRLLRGGACPRGFGETADKSAWACGQYWRGTDVRARLLYSHDGHFYLL
jgi:hypothetical protein